VKGFNMQTRSSLLAEQAHSRQALHTPQLKQQGAAQVLDTRDMQSVQRQAQSIANQSIAASQLKLLQAKMAGRADVMQRVEEEEPVQGKFATMQRVEEEELMQGKFATVQRVEEEEPVQGKFATVQRVEEEELVQGKFATVQRVEEEEPVQGKFATVQRVEEEEPVQGKFDTMQRVEEEELVQGKFSTVQRVEEEELVQGKFGTAQLEEKATSNNTGLPDQLKSGIESLSGMSMDHVKVHYNSSQPAQLNALAYAQGSDIHVAPGQEQHLPHEAWHVVQQAQGRVKPTMQMKEGVPVNDDAGLEHEADVMGAQAINVGQNTLQKLGSYTQLRASSSPHMSLVQCRYLTRSESAAGDIVHRDRADIFEESTLLKYRDVARRRYPSISDKIAAVKAEIDGDRDLDYKNMSGNTLTSYTDALAMVGDNREHMYVHKGAGIYRGDRTHEKLPHPALYGYDPDVDGAGTLRATFNNNTLRVKVTNSSGHFRPQAVDEDTRAKVEQKVRIGKPGGVRVFVDIVNQ
jgi:hypothetical protein